MEQLKSAVEKLELRQKEPFGPLTKDLANRLVKKIAELIEAASTAEDVTKTLSTMEVRIKDLTDSADAAAKDAELLHARNIDVFINYVNTQLRDHKITITYSVVSTAAPVTPAEGEKPAPVPTPALGDKDSAVVFAVKFGSSKWFGLW